MKCGSIVLTPKLSSSHNNGNPFLLAVHPHMKSMSNVQKPKWRWLFPLITRVLCTMSTLHKV